jgi:glyoxylase-like metal-dependent hydrolase (beta-lactamase superfamily II)
MNIYNVTDRISRVVVTLPNNPLRSLNSYIVHGNDRNLLIDTGFHLDVSFKDLTEGLHALDIDMERTDIFLTHCHADHTGNAGRIASDESVIYASAVDKVLINRFVTDNAGLKKFFYDQMCLAGFPEDKAAPSLGVNPAIKNNEPVAFMMTSVDEDHIFDLGGVRLRAFYTPGHTPGHMCLSVDADGILFTGDHILFDITPNITEWIDMDDALGSYMDSLRRVRGMDVRLALPAHREGGNFKDRIDALLDHHEARLIEALNIVAREPGQTCYEIASQMKWRVRGGGWDSFPLSQLYFAVGETKSHLRHLEVRGEIKIETADGADRFTAG